MAKGYWIPHLDVQDMKGFQAYRDTADAAHARFGSKLLVRGGRKQVLIAGMEAHICVMQTTLVPPIAAPYFHSP